MDVTLGQAVFLSGVTMVVSVGIAWGVLVTQVSSLRAQLERLEKDKCDTAAARIAKLEDKATHSEVSGKTLLARIEQHDRQADSLRGEITAMEIRLGAILTQQLEGLRRELRAGGQLKGGPR